MPARFAACRATQGSQSSANALVPPDTPPSVLSGTKSPASDPVTAAMSATGTAWMSSRPWPDFSAPWSACQ